MDVTGKTYKIFAVTEDDEMVKLFETTNAAEGVEKAWADIRARKLDYFVAVCAQEKR